MDSDGHSQGSCDESDYAGSLPDNLQMYALGLENSDIYARFSKRECRLFVPGNNSRSMCGCNRPASWHTAKAASPVDDTDFAEPVAGRPSRWSVEKCTSLSPTDAYGVLHFENFDFTRQGQNAKYIRLDSVGMSSPRLLWKLLTKTWRIPEPELIVSVTGGAKKMRPMSDKIIKKLHQGIINIATKTKTWMVTGGFNLGTNKLVGEAIRDYQLAGGSEHDVVLIGLCPWGSVRDRECLIVSDEKSLEDDLPVSVYKNPDNSISVKGQAVLEPHHTHFLLCDDGRDSMFGSEIDFRSRFESQMSEQMRRRRRDGDLRSVTACVHLIIEGGRKDVQAALVSVKAGAPVVVVKGSGRAANLIAFVCENTEIERMEIEAATEEHFSAEFESGSSAMLEMVDWLVELASDTQQLVNVYDAESMDPKEQLDRVILLAFLRQASLSAVTQLNLAMAWNRPDLAAQEIFSSESKHKWDQLTSRDLEASMLKALVRNQTEFVALLFDHGINIDSLLNRESLAELYRALLSKPDPQTMRLNEQLNYLNASMSDWLCSNQSKAVGSPMEGEDRAVYNERLLRSVGLYISDRSGGVIRNPYPRRDKNAYLAEDLLLWAIIMQRTEMARNIWRLSNNNISSALVAAMILRNMKSLAEAEGALEESLQLAAAADGFESLAVGVLSTCYAQDKQKTLDTVVRRLPIWDNQTTLTLADQGECMDFMSHPAVQTKLSDIWTAGKKTYLPLWRTLLCMLVPLFIPSLIFDKWLIRDITADSSGSGSGAGDQGLAAGKVKRSAVQPKVLSIRQSADSRQPPQQQQFKKKLAPTSLGHEANPSFIQCLVIFYTSPQVKFISSMASAVVFLLLFSYVVLVTLRHSDDATEEEPQPSVLEFLLLAWMVSLIAEEVRQIFDRNKINVTEKVKDWFAHVWDVFDFTLNVMMIACILARAFVVEDYFVWVRMTYALTLSFFYIRFMQFYLIHQALGPKVVMVTRMINDIVFFFAILAVFLMAYGVAAQALMYPNSKLSWKLLKDIVYLPYWQMYGELQLDDIQATDDKVSSSFEILRNDTDKGEPETPVHSPLVIVLFAFYMLITNVLLLNLLIAMFGHTFDQVQESSLKVWAFSRYKLIFEYYHRPFLCHPMTLLCHAGQVLEYAWRSACGSSGTKWNDFFVEYDSRASRMLTAFVHQGTDRYLSARRSEYSKDDDEDNWLIALEKLDEVKYQMEHLEAKLYNRRKTVHYQLAVVSRPGSAVSRVDPQQGAGKHAAQLLTPQVVVEQPSQDEAAIPTLPTAGAAEVAGSVRSLEVRLQGVEARLTDLLQAVESLAVAATASTSSAASDIGRRKVRRKSRRKSRVTDDADDEEATAMADETTQSNAIEDN